MKAIVHDAYGPPDVLKLEDVPRPVPGDGQLLVRVRVAAVNRGDWHMTSGLPYVVRLGEGLRRPKDRFLGTDLAGVVEAVGANVADLKPGDEVSGLCHGAFAEYACGDAGRFVTKPPHVPFEQAVACGASAITALQGLRDAGGIREDSKVLVLGASGSVGSFAVQLARVFGAEVTGVCSARNVDLVRSLGARHVFDYGAEDFAAGPARYDIVLDAVGNRSLSDCRRVLTPKGTLVLIGGPTGRWVGGAGRFFRAWMLSPFVGQHLRPLISQAKREDLLRLRDLLEAGTITAVIDRTFALHEVPEAVRYVGAGHARGKVVVRVAA